jgi:hypothetical protein
MLGSKDGRRRTEKEGEVPFWRRAKNKTKPERLVSLEDRRRTQRKS